MARLVAAFGSSHSIMLVSQREDWQHGFRVIDTKNAHYYDKQGRKTDYEALLASAPADAEAMVTAEKMGERYDATVAAMEQLSQRIEAARLDVLVIVGDDQTELFRTSNTPAFAIYYGKTIRNTAREPAAAGDNWVKSARMLRHEPEVDRDYPVQSDLAEWLIRQLCDRDFDITAMDGLEPGQFEGHAFQFVHRRLLREPMLPVVPVIVNTFDPPNQPTPRRCVALGAALRDLIAAWPQDLRVGVIASGGLSHFVVDEALDQQVIRAIRDKDSAAMAALDPRLLQAGSSEIRNWLIVGEMARDLDLAWIEYVPAYRTPALTGTGLAFAAWQTLD
ncbi:MAG: protocatechuate 3,4-dioxygenase [Hydrogenophaga sp.]|jgi:3-O-methylgallate 3,4-dioxygenase|uniref:DODA-type extradiol aromatic ring-opening family dioxygenase n=1 Tax=Hydrogenophaga sp. TaxID=1904254 RepID=UPI002A36D7EA|nr:protocatechuate 3,4-dioxygenase [Hydrogenophaga sp.]MDX9970183.1 protocatechuate 3,4-dioxygenase [Hydrogenophaga sp.]